MRKYIKRFFYLFISIKILCKIKSVKDLIKLKYKNLDIGKCLYEQFLRFEKRPGSIQIRRNILHLFNETFN